MARKASAKSSGGGAKAGGATRKPRAKKAAPPKAAKAAAAPKKAGTARARSKPEQQQAGQPNAADALIKLLESPLVVDLIAVGATAALAAIAEKRFGRRDKEDPAASRSAAKAAGKAAAAAMGRRIASEVEEIMKASKEAKSGGKP